MNKIISCVVALTVLGPATGNTQETDTNKCSQITFENYEECGLPDALRATFEEASKGDATALYVLGRLYEEGGQSSETRAITPNIDQAAKYYELAAIEGHMGAQATVAWIYNKYFMPEKKAERDYWNCKAALQKSYQATVNLRNQLVVTNSHETWDAFCADVLPKDEQPESWSEGHSQPSIVKDENEDCVTK